MENAATVANVHEHPSADEPNPKRQRLESTETKPPIILDEYGDLRLCVGADHVDQPSTYLDCSKALARLSSVMKKMLFGGFMESRPKEGSQGNWVVHLPDDQPNPMRLMLEIMHGDFGQVPETMDLPILHTLLVLMDKYDTISLTRPWARTWLTSAKTSGDHAKLLSVAWILGDMELFSTTTSYLVQSSTINEEGDLIIDLSSSTSGTEGGNRASQSLLLIEATAPLIPTSVIGECINLAVLP
ncbi:nuclear pore protein [Colletotrichum incanum]|uniref:Nuclear pore protein n=1 Tax=Colletotrichum incanum TaxID=1573173 RepID=A0A166WHG5_COLIC|nr:nuclear pore protein [Colletotrichum incanum]OHW98476.1 hypothetical protein CSPAE12_02895 [Colletotrichum incanum]